MAHVLRRRTFIKVNLEFTRSRNVLVIRLTLVCQVFYIGMKVYKYREIVNVTRSSL